MAILIFMQNRVTVYAKFHRTIGPNMVSWKITRETLPFFTFIISLRTSSHCEQFIRTEVPCDPAWLDVAADPLPAPPDDVPSEIPPVDDTQGLCSIQLPASHGQSSVREKKGIRRQTIPCYSGQLSR
jgi:hypothetical protein